jgi:hypothetical protein
VITNVLKLKHASTEAIGLNYVTIDSFDTAKSFSIEYTLLASNLPEEVRGTLHVQVSVEPG